MADATVGVRQNATPDRLIDNESLVVATKTVFRQRVRLAGDLAAKLVPVENVDPVGTEYGLFIREVITPSLQVALASAARTAEASSDPLTKGPNWRGVIIRLNVTAATGIIDRISLDLLVGTNQWIRFAEWEALALGAAGGYAFLVYPGAPSPGGWTKRPIESVVPATYRVTVTPLNNLSVTYDVTVEPV